LRRRWRSLYVVAALSSPGFAQPQQARAALYQQAHPADAAARIAAAFGVITSTFRTVGHNREVGGVPNSYHLLGRALDIVRRPGVSHAAIAAALRAAGYTLVESLDEGDHSHFAFAAAGLARGNPETPAPRAKPLLLADHHGTLLVDLAPKPVMASGTSGGGPTRSRLHARR